MVDLIPTAQAPPSSTSRPSPNSSCTCAAVVGLTRPKRLALARPRHAPSLPQARSSAPPGGPGSGRCRPAARRRRRRMAGAARQDQRERAGPEGLHQRPGQRRHVGQSGRCHWRRPRTISGWSAGRPWWCTPGPRPGRLSASAAGRSVSVGRPTDVGPRAAPGPGGGDGGVLLAVEHHGQKGAMPSSAAACSAVARAASGVAAGDVQVAHLAPVFGGASCRTGAGGRRAVAAPLPRAGLRRVACVNHRSPSRLSMTAALCRRGCTSGRFTMVRTCSSKLRHVAGVLAVVAAVVRARGDFVDHQAAVLQHEKLDAQHAHVLAPPFAHRNRALPA